MDSVTQGSMATTYEQSLLLKKRPFNYYQSDAKWSNPVADGSRQQRCFVCGVELASDNYVDHIQSSAHRLNLQRLGGSSVNGGGSTIDTDTGRTDYDDSTAEENDNRSYQRYSGKAFEAGEADGKADFYRSLWAKTELPRSTQPPITAPSQGLQHPRTDALLAEALAQLAQLRAERADRLEQAEREEREKRSIAWRRQAEAEAPADDAIESNRSIRGAGSSRQSSRLQQQQQARCDSPAESDTMLMVVTPLETGRTDATGVELLRRRSARELRETRDAAVATDAAVEPTISTVIQQPAPPAPLKSTSISAEVDDKANRLDFASQMPTPRDAAGKGVPVAAESSDCACGPSDSEVAAINGLAIAANQELIQQRQPMAPHRSREVERMQVALELSLQADQVDDVIGEVDARIEELQRQAEALQSQIAAEEAVRDELQQKRIDILQRRVDILRGCFELPNNEHNAVRRLSQEFGSVDYGFFETDNTASSPPPPPPPPDFDTDVEASQSGFNSDIQRRTLVQRVLLDDSENSAGTANDGGPLAVESPRDAELIRRTLDRLTELPPQHPPSFPLAASKQELEMEQQQQQQQQQEHRQRQSQRSGHRRSRGHRREATEQAAAAEALSDVMSAAPADPPYRPASVGGAIDYGSAKASLTRRTASETRLADEKGGRSGNLQDDDGYSWYGNRQRRRRVSGGRRRDDPAFAAALREYLHAASSSGGSASSDADAESSVEQPAAKPIRLEAHPGTAVLCAVSHDGLLYTGSTGGAGAILCLATRRRLAEFNCGGGGNDNEGSSGGVICLTLCDGTSDRLVVCSTSGVVSLHAARSGRQLAAWRLPMPLGAARARWGRLYLGQSDGRLATCDLMAPAEPVQTGWPALSQAITALEPMVLDDGHRLLAVGTAGGSVRLMDERNSRELAALGSGSSSSSSDGGAILAIRTSPDRHRSGLQICSVSESAVLIHRRSERRGEATWQTRRIQLSAGPTVSPTCLEVLGRWLLIGCSDGSVRCYTAAGGESPRAEATILIGSRRRPITSVAVCPASRLACGDALGRVELRRLPLQPSSPYFAGVGDNDDDNDEEEEEDPSTPTNSEPSLLAA